MMTSTENSTTATAVSPSPYVGHAINSAARAVFATVGSVMVVCGVTGNVCLLSVIFRRFQRKHCVHNLFIANLALADILTLGYWLTFFVLDLILGYYPVVDQRHCVANGVIIGILSVVSMLSLLSISLNRYLHVCHCHLYNRTFTLRRTVLSCLFTWILGLILSLPPALEVGSDSYHYSPLTHICSFNRQKLTYPKMVVVLFSTVPMLFIGYWNFAIFRFWRRARMSISTRYPIMAQGKAGRKSLQRLGMKNSVKPQDQDLQEQPAEDSDLSGNLEKSMITTEDSVDALEKVDDTRCGSESEKIENESSEDGLTDSENVLEKEEGATDDSESVAEEDAKAGTGGVEKSRSCAGELPSTGIGGHEKTATKTGTTVPETASPDPEHDAVNPSDELPGGSLTFPRRSEMKDTASKPVTRTTLPATGVKPPATCTSTLSQRIPSSKRQKHNLSKTIQNLRQKRRRQKAREMAFVRSLFVVFILMFICFIPYGVSIVVTSYVTIPDEVMIVGIMLLFTNNTVNWIVYGVMNPTFRSGYKDCVRHVLAACCCLRGSSTPSLLKASQSSLTTASVTRVHTDNDMDQSYVSRAESGEML